MTDRRHVVTDAHGRPTDFTSNIPVTNCRCGERAPLPRPRHWARTAVAVTAILTVGLVVSVLLLVVRDIVTTMAGTGVTGLVLKALLTTPSRRDR